MNDCKKCRDVFVDALYGDLSPDAKKIFESHLRECAKCRLDFEGMSSTRDTMSARIRPEPAADFWDGYWNRLAKRMEREQVALPTKENWWQSVFQKRLSHTPRWAYQAAASVLLVAVGIFLGRMFFTPSPVSLQTPEISQVAIQPGSQINVTQRAFDYIERSKLIMLAISNFDTKNQDPYALDLPYQQQISRELVQEASVLKQELADSHQRRLQELISDLEVILLQIANLESGLDMSAIELVKDGVKSRGILFKIHLSDTAQLKDNPNAHPGANRVKNKSKRF